MTYREELRARVESVRAWKKAYWTAALARCGGSVREAARQEGVNRTALFTLLRRLGVPVAPARRGNWDRPAADCSSGRIGAVHTRKMRRLAAEDAQRQA